MKTLLHHSKLVLSVFLYIVLFFYSTTYGQSTKTWVPTTGGAWTTAANWSPSGVPVAGDNVIINSDQSAAITAHPTISLLSLTISGNCNLTSGAAFGASNLITVTGAFSVAVGKTLNLGISGTGRTNFTLSSGATGTLNGTLNLFCTTLVNRVITINGNLTISNTGLITGQNNAQFTLASGATLQIANSAGITTTGATGAVQVPGTRTYSTGANYVYNGTSAQVTGNGLTQNTPANLTINNSSGVTLSAAPTVSGTLAVINGTLDAAAFQIIGNATNPFTLATGTTFRLSGVYPSVFTSGNTLFNSASTVEYYGATQTVSNIPTYGNLTIKTAGLKAAGGALTLAGGFTINTGSTFVARNFTHNIGGNFINNGIFTANNSRIILNGNAQSISGLTTTFNNLTLATNTSTKTFGVATIINGNLTINTGVKADLGTFRHTSATLTLGGTAQTTGTSYGGTSSPASTINTTFFANNTGYLNVGNCNNTYSLTGIAAATAICIGNTATINVTSTAANLPNGIYNVFYTLGAPNAGTGNVSMTVSGGTGSFVTTALTNSGATSIIINSVRLSTCVYAISSGNTAIITVNPNLPASVVITTSPSSEICIGTNVTFTATPTNGGTTPSYQWKLNGVNVGTNSNTYSNASLANGNVVTCVMTSNASPCLSGSPATSSSITMVVYSTPTIAEAGADQANCGTATFTLTGNAPTTGTGVWTVISGTATVTTPTSNVSEVTGVPVGTSATLRWTILNGTCTASSDDVVLVNIIPPTIFAGAIPNPICTGETLTLISPISVSSYNSILNEGFNGATNSWTTINNSTGGSPANAAWTLRPNDYQISCNGDNDNLSSNDQSQFYLTNSCEQGIGGTTHTILQSPVMSTVGFTTLELSFYHYFKFYDGSSAKVEVSTNGTTWTTLADYNAKKIGNKNKFKEEIINLDAYVGNATFYIRFKFDAPWGWYWAIDNVLVVGTNDSPIAWTGPNGFNSAFQNPKIPEVTVANSGTYTLTYTAPNGCIATGTVDVVVNPLPTITFTPEEPSVCLGSSTVLTASGAETYFWSPPEGLSSTTGATVTATPLTTTIYTVIGIDANGCSSEETIEVVVRSLPVIFVTPASALICTSPGIPLTARGAGPSGTYTWSPSTGLSSTTGTTVTATPSVATTYTVTGTTVFGCSSSETVFVDVIPSPPTTGVTICPGGTGELTATGICPPGNAITAGPRYPGTADTTFEGGFLWTIPANALAADDSSYAELLLSGPGIQISDYLYATKYGFTIPANATIIGIAVDIGRSQDDTDKKGDDIRDTNVHLINTGNNLSSTNYADTVSEWPEDPISEKNYGGNTDTWGDTWTPGYINSSGFGVALRIASEEDRIATVDYMRISVTYTIPGVLNWYTAVSGGSPIGTGTPFNPVGVAGSGLVDTNTPGTYTYYAECSSDARCRTATDFIINPNASITSVIGTSPICIGSTTTYAANDVVLGGTGIGAWSSDNTAIASVDMTTGIVTGVAAGTCNIIYTITGGCGGTTFKQQSITVDSTPATVGGSVTGGTTICSGATSGLLTLNGETGAVQRWEFSVNPFSTWTTISNTSSTYTSDALTETTQFRAVVKSGACLEANSETTTVTVDLLPNTPTVGTITNASCSETGSVVLNELPSGSWLINQTGTADEVYVGTGSSQTITGLAPGSYTFTVANSGCTSLATPTVIISGSATTTWTGSPTPSWNNGSPTNSMIAIISANYSEATNINACSLTVNNNAIVEIPSGFNVILNDVITVSSGSFTLDNNANLIQIGNTANTGAITVKRNSNALFRLDYSMWSTPVIGGQTLGNFSPLTNSERFYTYNPGTNAYASVPPATPFTTGTGYLIRMPNTDPLSGYNEGTAELTYPGVFTGKPNNGDISIPVANDTYNAIGNPYPSTIDADAFITDNLIAEALYFWRKKNAAAGSAYATYTFAGGVGTGAPSGSNALVPNGTIQVGQGFIAKSTSTSLNFTNSMRVANNANQFLKTTTIERHRVWLNLSKPDGGVNQMMVAYMTNATSGIDDAIDGKYINDSQTALTTIINTQEYTIQGRALPFNASDVVALGFKTTTAGTYTIAIDHVDGLFANGQVVYIKDNLTNTTHNLSEGAYTFVSAVGVFNSRFEMVYQMTLGTNNSVFNDNNVVVYKNNGLITINSGTLIIDNVKVFDISGRLLVEQSNVDASQAVIDGSKFANQMLLVQVSNSDGLKVTKKVIN